MAEFPTVEIYQQDGVTPVLLLEHPFYSGLCFSTQMPGGFAGCSFNLTLPVAVEHPELEMNNKVKVRSRAGNLAWEGRIEDLTLKRTADEELVIVGCLGPYTAMNDRLYNYVWVDRRKEQWWHPDTTGANAIYNPWHKSDMYSFYETERGVAAFTQPADILGIAALDGKRYTNAGWYTMWKYEAPSGQTVKRVTFDYKTFFPRGSWRLGVFRETGSAVVGTPITATGSGSKDETLAAASQRVWIFLQSLVGTDNDLSQGLYYKWEEWTFTGTGWSELGGYQAKKRIAFPITFPANVTLLGGHVAGNPVPDGTESYAKNVGTDVNAYCELTFTGTGITLIGAYLADAGIMEVWLKRGAGAYASQGTVDLYEEPGRSPFKIWETHSLDWDTYTVKLQPTNPASKNADSGGYEIWLDYALVDQGIWAQVQNMVVYCNPDNDTSIPVTADRVIKHALTQSCPDIDIDQTGIGTPGATLSQAVYMEDLRPSEVAERLAALGDGSGAQWNITVWDDWKVTFAARPTAVTHRVQLEDVEMDLRRSSEGMWSRTYGRYSDDRGNSILTPAYNDVDGQAKYGLVREYVVPVGRGGASQAGLAASIALQAYKDPGAQGTITLRGNLYTVGGLLVPLEEFRAGSVLVVSGLIPHEGIQGVVDNKTVFYLVQTEYNADAGTLTLTLGELPSSGEVPAYRGIGPTLMG